MKFLIASIAFCASICFSMAAPVYNVAPYGPAVGGYAAHIQPATVLNYAIPAYNIPAPAYNVGYGTAPYNVGLAYNAAPAYNVAPAYNAAPAYNVAPARASSAAAASASVQDNSYAAPAPIY